MREFPIHGPMHGEAAARPESIIPTVIETGPRGERGLDIFSMLLKERIVYMGTPINDYVSNLIVAQLLYLEREDPDKDINLYVNSPGGVITSGLAIYDTMQLIKPDVSTICVGMAASMGTVLLCGGAAGEAVRLAELDDSHAPSDGRRLGSGGGHRDCGAGDSADAGHHPQHPLPSYEAALREDSQRLRPRLLPGRG